MEWGTTSQDIRVSFHASSSTTWSNLDPASTFNATTPLGVLYSLKFVSANRSPRRLTQVHCMLSLPGGESQHRADENSHTSLPEVSLPALDELFLRGNIDACGMVLEKLTLPPTCTIYLDITANANIRRATDWIVRTMDRVRTHIVGLPSIVSRSRERYRWHRYAESTPHRILFSCGRQSFDSSSGFHPQIGILYEGSPEHPILPFDFILSLLAKDNWKFLLDDAEANQSDDEIAAWLRGSH